MSNRMGDLRSPGVSTKLEKIKEVVKNTTDSQTNLKEKLRSITEINTKLAQSYDVSLRIIVDVSKLLNQYIAFFNEIDELLNKLDASSKDNVTGEYIKYINRLTSDNIDKMTIEFKTQLQNIVPMFEKNDIPSGNLTEYGSLLDNINKEAKMLASKSGGGYPKKNPKGKSKKN